MPDRLEGVPDWLVERLAAQDFDAERAELVRARLAARDELVRLEQIEASNRAILEAYPVARVVPEIERRIARIEAQGSDSHSRLRRLTWPTLAVATPALALTAMLLASGSPDPALTPTVAPSAETVTSKGLAPHLVLYKKLGSEAARLGHSSRVRPGDVLQVAYVGLGHRYGVIASVDARGAVSLHLPENPGHAAELVRDGEVPVPHAFELDDSPGFERFVFAVSDTPFATATLVDALRSGTLERLSSQIELAEIVVYKEAQP